MVKKTGNILLALILLVSLSGFSINMHFCHEKLYDLALLTEAHSCCNDENHSHATTCHMPAASTSDNQHCDDDEPAPMDCQNRSVRIDSPDNFIISSFNFHDETEPLVLFLTSIVPVNLFDFKENQELGYIPYSDISPPASENTLALLQTYRN